MALIPETTIDLRSKAKLNYLVLAGEEWNDKMTFTNQDATPISLIGAAITMLIKSGATTLQLLTIGSGLTISGAGNNELNFEPAALLKGSYTHITRVELASGEVYTITGAITAY